MDTKEITFKADKLNFSDMDVSEAEFFTIEYVDPEFADALGIMGGKVYLMVDDLFNKFCACLWIEGEPVMELDEKTGEIVPTGEEKEPYSIEYDFTLEDLNAMQLRIIQYFHSMLYGGKNYTARELAVRDSKEAWRKTTLKNNSVYQQPSVYENNSIYKQYHKQK